MRIIIYTKITGFSGNVRFTIIARITRLPRNSRFTRNIRFTRCKNFKILAKSEYNEQISKYSRHIETVVQVQSLLSFVKLHWEGLKEDEDFNNATLAHEDGTQVRHTKSSSLHPVQNNTIFKQKSKSQLEQIYSSNGENRVKVGRDHKSSFWVPFHWRSLVLFPCVHA